ncbi:phage tail tape measure protein, TP901 family, core region [Staphylococcus aureus F70893]|uniref:phage tail tape measure protein n=3 Tax=Staphylococcus aureus TaxID=1280 RepID=UPI00024F10A0|nr:phage tail tape measure protein [Staphylococcus aureus]EHS80129.1 phage tail tape measure protein, TP901 family [Staphylococcus aureus subsp. aureus IS-160]HDQ3544701.1 phage tail tape measure protein [Staphylococcus aureus USA1000-CA-629]AWZ64335.1 phage tail tape measure protein, TP901 family, core region [Staphylococcus aureus]EGQ0457701.1 phage tail tape measure protein [Staphylococcus aureus]EJX2371822.1 phage tail tape measure protein [Staphylococcus aureus]
MGERIKGLSIGLDLDAANLNRSFAEIKRNFKTLNSDLKLTGNNFKYTEKSTDSYQQRIKELDGTIIGYKKNVDDLAKQYDKVSQEQGENSAEAQKLRQEYNKQANELNYLERELQKTSAEFEEFKKAQVEAQRMAESGWGKTSKIFESMGPKLTKMGDGLKSIGKGMMIGVTAPVLGIAAASGKAFAEVDKGLDTVTQATGATGGELKKLQNSFKDVYGNFPADAETVGGVLGEVNTRLGFTGKELESATESFLKFSHITGSEGVQAVQLITRAMGDAGIEADEYQSVLDMVAKAAQASGISVDTLADSITKYGAPMRAMGFEMKESIALFSQWEKSGVNTEIAFSGLKKAISNWGKAGKNPREEFKKTLAEIEKTPDIASATSLAIEAFGAKAGPDLADAIKGGRFSYQEFLKTIEDSQGTVNQTFKDSESGSERFKVAMNKLKLVGADVWTSIESAFAPVMEELIKKLSIAVDWFSNLSDGSKRSIVIFGGIAAAIGPVVFGLGAFISTIGNAVTVLAPLLAGIAKADGLISFLSTKVPILGTVFTALTGPIGIVLGVLAGLAVAFTIAYKKSETFRNFVNGAIESVKQTFSNFIQFIQPFIDSVKNIFKQAISAIVDFAKDIWSQINGFFNENGISIVQALQNICNFIKAIFEFIINFVIKPIMFAIWQVMQFIWPAVKALIVSTWENIKGVIQGALNIILGLIKFFSSLFTGDWRGVWDAIVMILKGVVQLIWNLIQLWFVGKILGVVRYFGGLLKGLIAGIWDVIKSIFSKSLSAIWNATKSIFGFLFNSVKSIFTNMKNWLSNTWSSIRTNTIGKAQSLFSGVKSKFTNLWNATKEIFSNLRNWMSNIWNSIKDNTVGIASRLWSKVRGIFTNMRDGLQSIISKIKSHIGGMVDAIKKGLNKLIDGLNWVGGKLGMDKIPKLHTGTEHTHTTTRLVKNGKIARDTFATVGDKGRGNGPNGFRNEMIEFPNGKRVLTPNTDTTAYLPKGSKVYNGAQTYSMLNGTLPRFSIGTMWKDIKSGASSAFNWTKDQIGKGTKWLGDKVGDVMDFIDNPGKLLNYVLQAFGVDFSSLTKGMGIAGDITKAAWSKIKKSAIKWLEDAFAESGDGGVLDMNKLRYLYGHTAAYTRETGRPFHEGLDFDYIYEPVPSTINGRAQVMPFHNGGYGKWVKIVKGALEVIYAHLSKYKVKTGQQVRVGQTVGISGNTGFSTGPHLHYEMRWNGRHRDPLPWLRKNNGGGKSTPGGNGAANARRAIKAAQNILGGRYKASWITNEMMRVASRESNYTANAVNNWDSNARAGIPSRGMFQMIDPSFRAYAKSGYNNPLNPTHQAISAMRYIVGKWVPRTGSWRAAFKRAGDYAYATGGKVFDGWYNLGEDGHPEWIIPTDPARRNDAMKILHYAAAEVRGKKASKNKRPSQLSDLNGFDDPSLLLKMIEQQQQQIALLLKIAQSNDVIADKDYQPIIDEYAFDKKVNASIEKRERQESTKVKFRKGGIAIQ